MLEKLKDNIDNTIRELKKMENSKNISIPILPDEDGYLDKECPNPSCLFQFKVNANDWENNFKDEQVFCPKCHHAAKSWLTSEQVKEGKDQIVNQMRKRIRKALNGGSTHDYNFTPIKAKAEITQKTTCGRCNSRFAAIENVNFCPCCGNNLNNKL
jgi:hypothetical protein